MAAKPLDLKICSFYNKTNTCRGGEEGTDCHALHICKHYINDDCKFGQSCKKSHNLFVGQPKAILAKCGFDLKLSQQVVLEKLKERLSGGTKRDGLPVKTTCPYFLKNTCKFGDLCKNLHSAPSPKQKPVPFRAISHDEEPVICSYYLKDHCNYGTSCRNIHSQPYQWQYFSKNEDWISFKDDKDGNQDIEKHYSDPNQEICYTMEPNSGVRMEITFEPSDGMIGKINTQIFKIRRVSTPSAGKDDNHRFPTEWFWYFKNDNDQWQEYQGSKNSEELERKFQENPQGIIQMSSTSHQYELDFSTMKQQNSVYRTLREMRRRPRFQTKSSMKERSRKLNSSPIYPDHWDLTQLSNDFNKIRIDDRAEISKICSLFAETIPNVNLISVERIQNPELWEDFLSMKKKMEKHSGTSLVEERLLFHGTNPNYLEAICQQGFDWRMAGTSVGTLYGKGSYFAKEARYSDAYNHKSKKLLVVRVLVGAYTKGQPTDLRPAPKDPSKPLGELYNSNVDNVSNPKIFVVFEKRQAYPEYLITY